MATRDIDSTQWTFRHDLDDVASAAGFSADYQRLSARRWDSDYYDDIRVYRGEANPDLVRVFVTTDGFRSLLVEGVVDGSGRTEQMDGTRGRLAGRDKMALLLDRRPTTAFTIQGATVDEACTISFGETFMSAVQALMADAGIPVQFEGPIIDYRLGRSMVVTRDRTYAEYLQELLTPLRWSEKHRVDTWVEGGKLYVVHRDEEFRGEVVMARARVTVDTVEKVVAIPQGGIRVEGWNYQCPEDDLPDEPTPGLPWSSGYTITYPVRTSSITLVSGRTETYETEEIEWYDARGNLLKRYTKTTYLSRTRTEERTYEATYENDPTLGTYNAKLTETERVVLTDFHSVPPNIARAIQGEVIRDKKSEWTYYDDGDPKTMDAYERELDESGDKATSPLKEKLRRTTRMRYRRTSGYTVRETEIVEFKPNNVVQRTFEVSEVGPFKLETRGGRVTGSGKKMVDQQVSAGPDDAVHVFSSDLLGDQASVDAIRDDLLDDQANYKLRVSVTATPNAAVRAGHVVAVDALRFFLTSLSMSGGGSSVGMTMEGVAWLAV